MQRLSEFPPPLARKLMLTPLVALAVLVLGLAFYTVSHDRVILLLSAAVFLGGLAKAAGLYWLLAKQKYFATTGVCKSVERTITGRHKKVVVELDDGSGTLILRLSKRSPIKVNEHYTFYFAGVSLNKIGSEYFDSVLATDSFLGYG